MAGSYMSAKNGKRPAKGKSTAKNSKAKKSAASKLYK